jgi:hypothetical protein
MKNLIKLLSLLTFAGFILTSCEGPMGPAGSNGLDGLDGKDANAACIICHTTENFDTKEAQYESSDKGERGARPSKYCARCHSTEGFKEILGLGTFNTSNDVNNGTHLSCETCHKHRGFDFTGDTVSMVLRTVGPVYTNWNNFNMATFAYAKTNATDYKNTNNLCANCHQYRGTRYAVYSDATVVPAVTNVKFTEVPYFPIVNTSSNEATAVKYRAGTNFDIHEGANQADYLTSKNGYEYTGKTYTRKTTHSSYQCTDCHFNEYNATTNTGGHTMRVNLTDPKCISCHNIASKRIITLAAVNAKLTELGDLLVTRKVFKKTTSSSGAISYAAVPSHDFYGTLLPTTVSTTKFALTIPATNTVSPTTGLTIYNNVVTWANDPASTASVVGYGDRIGRDWKYGELGAAWNYKYVNTVATTENKAVHNPTYAMELLQTSIDWLKANP